MKAVQADETSEKKTCGKTEVAVDRLDRFEVLVVEREASQPILSGIH